MVTDRNSFNPWTSAKTFYVVCVFLVKRVLTFSLFFQRLFYFGANEIYVV